MGGDAGVVAEGRLRDPSLEDPPLLPLLPLLLVVVLALLVEEQAARVSAATTAVTATTMTLGALRSVPRLSPVGFMDSPICCLHKQVVPAIVRPDLFPRARRH